MSDKLEQLKQTAEAQLQECGVSNIDHGLLGDIASRFKMMLGNKDAMLVSGADPTELETVRKNFVEKKLGIEDKEKGAAAVQKVADAMSGIRMKNRVAFYCMVQKELD